MNKECKENFEFHDLTKEDYEILSKIFRSNSRRKVIISILNGKCFPKQIRNQTKICYQTISKTLRLLEKDGFIICQNPEAKRGRIFIPSEKLADMKNIIFKWNEDLSK
ncbi:MAG: hypothetical protein ACW964_01640 [Candidatus Hodarchaeales archaeon]|jgi:DNA-binding MarR family transcriptional regulator